MSATIVALATPTGRSGIGVVRLSGTDALEILGRVTDAATATFPPRRARLLRIKEPDTSEIIDEAVATFFQAPRSFTGEDVVEIACHGSPVLLRRVLDLCLASGARLADPGEFTMRALASGRIDLTEAEAIRDLIDARTTASARQAVRQMRGEFSHELQPVKDDLLNAIVVLESALEFVEDDLPITQTQAITARLRAIARQLDDLAGTFRAGRLIRDGLKVAIVGRPNVGKSSLFNALLGSDRAIVTDIAGTTRDQLHEQFTIHDVPVSLIDTAGLRETVDTVEKIGVERSRRAMADADLVLVILDVSVEVTEEDREIIESAKEQAHLIVLNKIDKPNSAAVSDVTREISVLGSDSEGRNARVVSISAKTGSGLDELRHAILQPFADPSASTGGFLVTDARHHDLLSRAAADINGSIDLIDSGASEEITLVGLHNAIRYLGEITGETTTEDMLSRIFETFCIGK